MPAPLIVPLILLGGATIALAAASAKRKRTEPDVPLGTPKTYTLDVGLPQHLCGQVLAALSTEKNPTKLEDFAAAIVSSYPLSAAALRIKKGAVLSAQTATPYPRFAPTPQTAPAPPASFAQAAPLPPADSPLPTQAPAATALPNPPPPVPSPAEMASVAGPTPIVSTEPPVPAPLASPAPAPELPESTQAAPVVTAATSASAGGSPEPVAPAPPTSAAVAVVPAPSPPTISSDPAAATAIASPSPSAEQLPPVQAPPDATVAASTPTSPAPAPPVPAPQEAAAFATSSASNAAPEPPPPASPEPVVTPAPSPAPEAVVQTSSTPSPSPPAPQESAVTPSAAAPSEAQAPVGPPSPPTASTSPSPAPGDLPASVPSVGNLDPGMPPDMQRAVTGALGTESDPGKLEGFASAITAQYPLGARVLMAKAQELRLGLDPGSRAPSASSPPPAAAVADGGYKVVAGDFPIRIATKLTGDGNRWPELVAANPQKKTGADGNFASLQPGEVLRLPESWSAPPTTSTPSATPAPAPAASTARADGTYKVLAGDFPIRIAKKLTGDGARWPELVAANPQKKTGADGNFASLQPGEVLHLPDSWSPAPTTTATLSTGGSHAAHP